MRQYVIALAALFACAAPAAAQDAPAQDKQPEKVTDKATAPAAGDAEKSMVLPIRPAPRPPARPVAPPPPPPLPPPPVKLEMFNQRNFKGTMLTLGEGGSNIQFSPRAARVTGGPWMICARPFFGGRCDTIEGENPRLNLHRAFSGTVRSARPVDLPSPPPPK